MAICCPLGRGMLGQQSLSGPKYVSRLYQSCPKVVSKLVQSCIVSKLYQSCVKVFQKLYQFFRKIVSKLFQVGLNVVHVIQYVWRNKTYHFYQLPQCLISAFVQFSALIVPNGKHIHITCQQKNKFREVNARTSSFQFYNSCRWPNFNTESMIDIQPCYRRQNETTF